MTPDLPPDEIERLLALARGEVRARLRVLGPPGSDEPPTVPPGFDPRRASPAELERYGLPARPDAVREKLLHRHWLSLMQPGMRFIRPGFQDLAFNVLLRAGLRQRDNSAEAGHGVWAPTRWGTSLNWSGAVLAASEGLRFDRVAGSWIVPGAAEPAGGRARHPTPDDSFRCSHWIGLDGYRAWSRALPQIGTASVFEPDPVSGVLGARSYAWVQWWVRGQHFGEVVLPSLPVAPGDRIHALLEVRPPRDQVAFSLTRERNGEEPVHLGLLWAAGRLQVDGKGPDTEDPFDRSLCPVEGLHAVWCVERPASLPTASRPSRLYALPRFGGAAFRNAVARGRGEDGAVAERDLQGARHIRMVGRRGQAVRVLTSPELRREPARFKVAQTPE
jgi:hypothetical protein